jgi:chaperonin GroES
MASLKPLGDRVVIERVEEKTTSGIIIPDTAKEKPVQGKVLAVGPGNWNEDGDERIALDVKVGDLVLFTKWGGTEFKLDGKEVTILKESDLLGIISSQKESEKSAQKSAQKPTLKAKQKTKKAA